MKQQGEIGMKTANNNVDNVCSFISSTLIELVSCSLVYLHPKVLHKVYLVSSFMATKLEPDT